MGIDIVKQLILSKTGNHNKLVQWLNLFSDNSTFKEKKILICLAIDLFSGNLVQSKLDYILQKLDVNQDIYTNFHETINQHIDSLIPHANYNLCGCSKDTYIVVMKKSHLTLLHNNNNNNMYRSTKPSEQNDDIEEIDVTCLHKFPKDNPKNRRDLWWVAPKSEIERIVTNYPDTHATEIINQMGIDWIKPEKPIENDVDNEIVYLEISQNFDEICWQPTVFDGESELFISYKKDNSYGRTRSVDGSYPIGVAERVFLGFSKSRYIYKVSVFNKGKPSRKKIDGDILKNSYERLVDCL